MSDLIVIDGANLFNSVGRMITKVAGATPGPVVREYMRHWFHVDRLIRATTIDAAPMMGNVIFHSPSKPLGRPPYRIESNELNAFWGKQGARPHTSCIAVDIPGEQHETIAGTCDGCGHEMELQTTAEKGVDMSIASYLFESADAWRSVTIFSRDADFVPAVLSLRRSGHMVYCACEPGDEQTALVRVCQNHRVLSRSFLEDDFAAFLFFRPGGMLDAGIEAAERLGARAFVEWKGAVLEVDVVFDPHAGVAVDDQVIPPLTCSHPTWSALWRPRHQQGFAPLLIAPEGNNSSLSLEGARAAQFDPALSKSARWVERALKTSPGAADKFWKELTKAPTS